MIDDDIRAAERETLRAQWAEFREAAVALKMRVYMKALEDWKGIAVLTVAMSAAAWLWEQL